MKKLVSMKLPKPSKQDTKVEAAMSPSTDEYPYGLKLHFDDDRIIDRLPILRKVDINETVKIAATACVTSIDLDKRQESKGPKERLRITLQIEGIAIERPNDEEDAFNEAAEKKE